MINFIFLYVRTARHVIHMQFNISPNALEIRAIKSKVYSDGLFYGFILFCKQLGCYLLVFS
jgi:hypothetical protein